MTTLFNSINQPGIKITLENAPMLQFVSRHLRPYLISIPVALE
jgi:hypothetical protein